jgi:Rhodopirellula transposase DDE domain
MAGRFPCLMLPATSVDMIDAQAIRQRWEADGSKRDERGRRLFAASEVRAAGWGGLAAVSSITGLARSTIERGLKDLDAAPLPKGQVRREGGGPRPLTGRDPTLLGDLKRLVEPATVGDPIRPLLWVSKSLDKLASALTEMGHPISPNRHEGLRGRHQGQQSCSASPQHPRG